MLAAPHATTTTSAAKRSSPPSRSTTTSVTAVPASFVSSLTTFAFVSSVTFACSSAGRTPSTSASDLRVDEAGEAVAGRAADAVLNGMFDSSSMIPHGAWNGW